MDIPPVVCICIHIIFYPLQCRSQLSRQSRNLRPSASQPGHSPMLRHSLMTITGIPNIPVGSNKDLSQSFSYSIWKFNMTTHSSQRSWTLLERNMCKTSQMNAHEAYPCVILGKTSNPGLWRWRSSNLLGILPEAAPCQASPAPFGCSPDHDEHGNGGGGGGGEHGPTET